MADFPRRLRSVETADELRDILEEIVRRGADGWRRRHVERHLASDYDEVIDRWADSDGVLKLPSEEGSTSRMAEEDSGCGRVVRWIRNRTEDRAGIVSLRDIWSNIGGYNKTYQEFIDAVRYCVDEEEHEGVSIVEGQIAVLKEHVNADYIRRGVKRACGLPQYAVVENEEFGRYRGLLSSAWGCEIDQKLLRHGTRAILSNNRHIGALCYVALARREEPGAVSQIAETVNRISIFDWPQKIVRERLTEDWRFWPVGSDEYILSDDRTKGRPPDGDTEEVARRLLAAVSERIVSHSSTGGSPLELNLRWNKASRLRCYLHWVEESTGSSNRYYTSVRAEVDKDNRLAFDRSDGRIAIVCGYCEAENVFVLWDAGILEGYRSGHTVSVGSQTVFGALVEDVTTERRNLKRGQEVVVAAREGKVDKALERRIDADRERLLEEEYTVEETAGEHEQERRLDKARGSEESKGREDKPLRDLSWRDRHLGSVSECIITVLSKAFPNALTISELTKRVQASSTGRNEVNDDDVKAKLKGPLYRHVRQMARDPKVWVLKSKGQRES